MVDKKIAVETSSGATGAYSDKEGQLESSNPSPYQDPDSLIYDSGMFIAEPDPDQVQYGTRVDAPLVAGSKVGDDWPVAFANQLQGSWQRFSDKYKRDAWGSMYKSRLFNTVAFVSKGENNYPSVYSWSGKNKDGSDGAWAFIGYLGGVAITDTNGALLRIDSTIVLGEGLSLEAAGDQGNGVIIKLDNPSSSGGNGSMPFGMYGHPDTFNKYTSIAVEWPLEVIDDPDTSGLGRITMKHGLWQLAQAPNFLAYTGDGVEIVGKESDHTEHKGKIWFDDVVCPAGAYIELDMANKRIGLQEADDKDPNVSGGMMYYVALVVSPTGHAPESGFIQCKLYDESNDKIAEDLNGNLLGVQVNYQNGSHLKPGGNPILITGLLDEKGIDYLSSIVSDSFSDDIVALGDRMSGPTGLMIQAITQDNKAGDALRQFQLDTGIQLRDKVEWVSSSEKSLKYVLKSNEQSDVFSWRAANTGLWTNDGWDLNTLSPVMGGIENGTLRIKSAPADKNDVGNPNAADEICDFYFGYINNEPQTEIMRGQEAQLVAYMKNPQNGVEFSLVYYDGDLNMIPRVFDARNNGSIVLHSGWKIVTTKMAAEKHDGAEQTITITGLVPKTAKRYGWISYPSEAESPMDVTYLDLIMGAKTPFHGYVSKRPIYPSELAIEYDDEKGVFLADNKGLQSLRYTLRPGAGVDVGLAMPCGRLAAGALDIEVDHTANVVNGSDTPEYDGCLKFKNDGKFSNHYTYVKGGKRNDVESSFFVYPGESLKWGQTSTVKMWWAVVSSDGSTYTKIPESETTHTVKFGDIPQKVVMRQWSQDFEGGDRIALRGWCDISDGAYILSDSGIRPLVYNAVEYKEIKVVS